ncbi:endo-1,4-beta-xylanase [Micromonospora sonneratiae]|uniref:Beta-xylanase n=1 Tax=Micromonospora sonneratiae TaxID=1184706 RepID=A0ABW3YDW3_9ACTN
MNTDSTHPPGRNRRTLVGALTATAVAAVVTLAAAVAVPTLADAATTLKSLADAKGKDIGFALDPNRLSETAYKNIADTEFNLVVAENAMKWDATEPSRGSFNWSGADQVANYATTSGKRLYGHTLVWHSQLPDWVSNLTSATELRTAMVDHINGVAGRYRGRVTAWDVVNEAFNDDGSRRSSVFQQRLGDGYIEEAFRAARAADPTAKLCINDYSTDGINNKSTAIYNLVTDFKARGVPIDCVGFQAHLIVGQVPSNMQQNLQRFADLGVDVRITELDIRMQTPADATKLANQAADYRRVFQACLAVSRCVGVTTWGITDRYSWVPGTFPGQGAALIWDDNYIKKPAYDAVTEALGGTVPSPTTPGPSPTATTPPPPGGCRVSYTPNTWNTGFTTEVVIGNLGSSAINGWTLTFSFTAGQQVTGSWNSTVTQSGAQVSVRNAAWNGTIAPNGTQNFGFQGTHGGTNPTPTSFALNGTACTTG